MALWVLQMTSNHLAPEISAVKPSLAKAQIHCLVKQGPLATQALSPTKRWWVDESICAGISQEPLR